MTALVTGAGGAIGRAVALRLSADGHTVAVVDIDGAAAAATVEAIEANGGHGLAIECDLSDDAQLAAAFTTAIAELGPIDVLINNAAVFPSGPFVDVTVDELDRTTDVNQRGYFLCAQHAARSMIEKGGGSIVNVASITWHGGWADMAPYVATKGAIVALTRALATELGEHEIRVNAVAPGAFPTAAERAQHDDLEAYEARILESQALPRRGTLEELAAVVSFLAGPESSFVTGQTLNVDGGWIMS
ncbi:MAG: SDR family NAD(P)-dependent oxidoreductase [Acidimicrobiia bacterium]|nr:SDR family NAD(P)-dependent oxidoreductase [Acidimicrobiia bacterium]